jgi:hypothetical protein
MFGVGVVQPTEYAMEHGASIHATAIWMLPAAAHILPADAVVPATDVPGTGL